MVPVERDQPESARPERTCVGCRARDVQHALLRFAFAGDPPRIAPDVSHKLGGRGASVHPRRACLDAAARKGGFSRAFRHRVEVDPGELAQQAYGQYVRRLEGLLQSALRTGCLSVGTDAVRRSLRGEGRGGSRPPVLLVVAEDAAGRREELERAADQLGGACVIYGTKKDLGRLFGRDEVGVLAISDAGIAREVAQAAACATELSEGE